MTVKFKYFESRLLLNSLYLLKQSPQNVCFIQIQQKNKTIILKRLKWSGLDNIRL